MSSRKTWTQYATAAGDGTGAIDMVTNQDGAPVVWRLDPGEGNVVEVKVLTMVLAGAVVHAINQWPARGSALAVGKGLLVQFMDSEGNVDTTQPVNGGLEVRHLADLTSMGWEVFPSVDNKSLALHYHPENGGLVLTRDNHLGFTFRADFTALSFQRIHAVGRWRHRMP